MRDKRSKITSTLAAPNQRDEDRARDELANRPILEHRGGWGRQPRGYVASERKTPVLNNPGRGVEAASVPVAADHAWAGRRPHRPDHSAEGDGEEVPRGADEPGKALPVRPEAPVRTQQRRKYANQHQSASSEIQTTRHSTVATAWVKAGEAGTVNVKAIAPEGACRFYFILA